MKIKVEQRHINAGCRHRCKECPVALAILEATGVEVAVYPISGVYFGNQVVVGIPWEVSHFIGEFDHGLPVQPFEFVLDWPPQETSQ